jgi:hypothetical protein
MKTAMRIPTNNLNCLVRRGTASSTFIRCLRYYCIRHKGTVCLAQHNKPFWHLTEVRSREPPVVLPHEPDTNGMLAQRKGCAMDISQVPALLSLIGLFIVTGAKLWWSKAKTRARYQTVPGREWGEDGRRPDDLSGFRLDWAGNIVPIFRSARAGHRDETCCPSEPTRH